MLREDHLVDAVLSQLRINPDARLTISVLTYLRLFPSIAKISNDILIYLDSPANLFDYQEAMLLNILRSSYKNKLKIIKYARKIYLNKKKHWYVRCQALNILADTVIRRKSFGKVIKMYVDEKILQVKRASLKLICQIGLNEQREILLNCAYDPHYKMATLGKMLLSLRYNSGKAKQELDFIFRSCDENKLRDNFYKLGVIRFNKDKQILEQLKGYLTKLKFPYRF